MDNSYIFKHCLAPLYMSINLEGSVTKPKWCPAFQDLKISDFLAKNLRISKFHRDLKISLRFQRFHGILIRHFRVQLSF